jgi:hypothetical protein
MGWPGSVKQVTRDGTEGLRCTHKALEVTIGAEQRRPPGSKALTQKITALRLILGGIGYAAYQELGDGDKAPAIGPGSTVYQIVAWRHRHIMDVGTMTQDVEVPQRWLDAVISMLAAKLASEIPEVPADMIPLLDAKATQAELEAWGEERDNSPIRWAPNISAYTR